MKTKQPKEKKVNKLKGYKGLRKLIPFYKRYSGMFFLTILFLVLSAVAGFFNPIFKAEILARLTDGKFNSALIVCALLIGVRIIVSIFNYLHNVYYVKMDSKVVFDIKNTLITAITKVKMSKNDQTNNGVYIERLNQDADKCSDVLIDIMSVMLDVISNIGFLIYIAFLDYRFFLILLFYVVVLWVFDSKKERVWYKQRKHFREKRDISTGAFNEQIRSLRDLKSLNISKSTIKDSDEKFQDALQINIKSRVTRRNFVVAKDIVAGIFEVGFLVLGIWFIKEKWIYLTEFLVIYMYHGNIRNLTSYFAAIKQYAIEGELAAQRIFEVINDFPKEQFGDTVLENSQGLVEFKDVTFAYEEGKTVLDNISLTFEPHKTTAIVGKSGSGKSTILSLINKLYDVEQGEILLDNININSLTEDSLRNNVGVVTQAPYIFNRTIRENLAFINPQATEEEMISALKRAQIYDFIKTLGSGLDSKVGENGVMLSGGQKQRLAIARILLKNSPVIVLDEATSALDNESQGNIVEAIDALKNDHTIIIVAHRLSTIVDADTIVVLDGGKVVDKGTHKQLFKRCKLYRELYKSEETADQLTQAMTLNEQKIENL